MSVPQKSVYLAGPITGLTYGEARHGWREAFATEMSAYPHIQMLSPMRGKNFLIGGQELLKGDPQMYKEAMGTAKGILARDTNDVSNCDVMVACFLGVKEKVSIGTCFEFGMAHVLRKPIVLIMEKDLSNIHSHAFLTESAGYWVDTLEEAAFLTMHMLTPGV